MKFARVDTKENKETYVVFYVGNSIEDISRDIDAFSDYYDIATMEELQYDDMLKLCRRGWGKSKESGSEKGYEKLTHALVCMVKGSKTYCIDHLNKEWVDSDVRELVPYNENSDKKEKLDITG